MNLYQDETEIVVVDAAQVVDAQLILVLVLAETTAAYGLFFCLSSVADAEVILSVEMDVAEMTAVSGSFFCLSSVVDVEIIHGVIMVAVTMAVDATTAANQRNFEDGSGRPFCM